MDPSLSVSNDPHHTSFTTFPPFNNPNPFAAPQHTYFTGAVNNSAVAPPMNNQFFQPPPQPAPQQSNEHPPYADMICSAIAALNEPDGSSKQAISRFIERGYSGIPQAHGALMTHHLKSLKNNGVLTMVKKSYKFAAPTPPTSVAVAAAAAAAGLEHPRSDFMTNVVVENQPLPDPAPTSTPQTQKRGRGRPPKPKPDVQPNEVLQSNGKSAWVPNQSPLSRPEEEMQPQTHAHALAQAQPLSQIQPQFQIQPQSQIQPQPLIKRPPGRPRKDGSSPTARASVSGGVEIAKRRGRPPSGRAAGRERKPAVVSAPPSVIPYVANGGVRRRGRPRRVDTGASYVAPPPPPPNAETGGDDVAVVVAKRGRGRPPKIGGAIRKAMKPQRGYFRSGRPVGRPRKNAMFRGASGQQDAGYGELKEKFELFQEKAKGIVNVLKAEIGGSENQAVVQAIQELEGLTVTTTVATTVTRETTDEPQHMEEMLADEQHRETDPEPEGQGQGQAEGQGEAEGQGQGQTDAEAMQEALF
ncbi:unnamed protein product [Thlaspi arvense]|uniref:H15 domain-containing protein n=1 Tax=Thlaspi arvense TaxID=13288 RepID=A0AAU9R8M6_THLAR|nr:unnamed protein product [Thlaspi arvense]